jgi:hypothetical protein
MLHSTFAHSWTLQSDQYSPCQSREHTAGMQGMLGSATYAILLWHAAQVQGGPLARLQQAEHALLRLLLQGGVASVLIA